MVENVNMAKYENIQKKDVTFQMTGYYLSIQKAYAYAIQVCPWLKIT